MMLSVRINLTELTNQRLEIGMILSSAGLDVVRQDIHMLNEAPINYKRTQAYKYSFYHNVSILYRRYSNRMRIVDNGVILDA